MVVADIALRIVEGEGDFTFHRVILSVIAVATHAFTAEEHGVCKTVDIFLLDHAENAVGVTKVGPGPLQFVNEPEAHAFVDDRLLF